MSIIKDSVVYLACELFAKALPFLLLPYLARKLGVADFGVLSYWQSIMALLIIAIGISQEGSVSRYYYVYGQRNLPALVGTSLLYTSFISLILLTIAALTQSLMLFAVILAAASQAMINVQLSLQQCQKHAKSYAIIQIGTGIATTAITLILLEYTQGWLIEKRFIALFIGNIGLCVLCLIFQRQLFRLPQSRRKFKRNLLYLFSFGLPLIVHQLSLLAKGQFDRIMLYHFYSADQLGIYAAAYQIATGLSVLLMAISKATTPYYFESIKKNKIQIKDIKRYTLIALAIAPLPSIIMAILPESVYLMILGKDFVGVRPITLAFVLGFGLTLPYFILVNYLFYLGQNAAISRNSIQAAVAYLLVLWLVLPLGIHYTPLAMITANLLILPLLWRQIGRSNPQAT